MISIMNKQVHGEFCALLIEVLESLKTNLMDFSCVLPKHNFWIGLISVTTSNINPSERLEQLTNGTKVLEFFPKYSIICSIGFDENLIHSNVPSFFIFHFKLRLKVQIQIQIVYFKM